TDVPLPRVCSARTSPVHTAVARKGLVVTRDTDCFCAKRIKSSRRVRSRCLLRDPEMREISRPRAQKKKPAVAEQCCVGADTVRDGRLGAVFVGINFVY
ncbi:hypothetical protein TcCL_Unassigned06245, partial [Trypanosoma cruzi]